MNNVILVGRICRDVVSRQVGTSYVLNTGVAVDREFTGKDGKKEADYIDIEVWVSEKSYVNYHQKYTVKGALVSLQGSIKVDTYKNQAGENRKSVKVTSQNKLTVLKFANSNASENQVATEPAFEPAFDPTGLGKDFSPEEEQFDDIPF